MGCARKVVKSLTAVSGVKSADADVDAKTVTVTPEADKTPSPKAMWEAIENAGYKPSKIEGPSGTFKEKPKS